MYRSLVIHQGHLDCSQVLAIIQIELLKKKNLWAGFYVNLFSVPLGKYQNARLVDGNRMLSFVRNCLSSKMAVPFCIPTSNE